MRRFETRLNLAEGSGLEHPPHTQEPAKQTNEERLSYYLQQPKAKAANYLKPEEIILFHTGDGWERARLLTRHAEYRETGYEWTFEMVKSGTACSAHLGQGRDDWGVLRGDDLALDYDCMDPKVSTGRKARARLVSECTVCKETNMSIYPEERSQLMSFIPFTCRHRKEISGLESVAQGEPNEVFTVWDIPRPKQPRIAIEQRLAPSEVSQVSSFAVVKIVKGIEDLEASWLKIAGVNDSLLVSCEVALENGVETGHPDITIETVGRWPQDLMEAVDALVLRGEAIHDQLSRLEPVHVEVISNLPANPVRPEVAVSEEEISIESVPEARIQLEEYQTVEDESEHGEEIMEGRAQHVDVEARSRQLRENLGPQLTFRKVHNRGAWEGPMVTRATEEKACGQTPAVRSVRAKVNHTRIHPNLGGGALLHHSKRPLEKDVSTLGPRMMSKGLQRARDRVVESWEALEPQFEGGSLRACSLEQARYWREEVARIEDSLMSLEEQYDDEIKFLGEEESRRVQREKKEVMRRISQGVRGAPIKIGERLASHKAGNTSLNPVTNNRSVSRVERVALPRFSGRIEEWADFRHLFSELVRAEDYPEVVMMVQLRERIPKEAVNLLAGVVEVKEAWERLNKKYGDKEQAILQAKHRLRCVKLGTGPAFEQIDNLRLAVQTARAHLMAVGAGEELFADRSIFGHLINKVPHAYQERWHLLATDAKAQVSTESTGEIFTRWLEREGEAANSARLMRMNVTLSKEEGGNTMGHPKYRETPTLGSLQTDAFAVDGSGFSWRERLNTRVGANEVREALKKRIGVCPACKQNHSYTRQFSWGTDQWPSQRMEACPAFIALTPVARAKLIEDEGGCGLCSSTSHVISKCFAMDKNRVSNQDPKCREPSIRGGGVCGKLHHRLLHGSGNAYCQANLTVTCLLELGGVESGRLTEVGVEEGMEAASFVAKSDAVDRTARCLFEHLVVPVMAEDGRIQHEIVLTDTAANTNFITHGLAKELGARGTAVEYSLKVVDSQYRKRRTLAYNVAIIDRMKKKHWIYALGVDVITDANPPSSLKEARRLFPNAPAEVFRRPMGPVRVLISMTERHLHSSGGQEIASLRLAPTPLGCGWVLTGLVPIQGSPLPQLSGEVCALMAGQIEPPLRASTFNIQVASTSGGFQEAEEMGYLAPPMCPGCKSCRTCEESRTKVSQDDRKILERVEREMVLVPGEQRLEARYPWKPCASKMVENLTQATKIQGSIERRQIRDKRHSEYVKEFQKLMEKGAIRSLSQEEREKWKGPVNYNALFCVHKESSVSTKTRIVSNSAQKNQYSGLSLNECMFQGPDCLASMLDVLLHWRVVEESLVMDLEKAYQAIYTGNGLELHLRRVLFRDDPGKEWQVYAFTRATFGDLAAGLLLEVAKKKAAEAGGYIDPFAARQLVRFTYVDDGLPGGSREDVDRMLGKDGQGTMSRILATCGLKAKFMVRTGDPSLDAAKHLGGKVLGLGYHLASDQIRMTVPMGPLNPTTTGDKNPTLLTKRKVLSFLMSAFDPLGLLSPILLEGKVLLRRLYGEADPGWDKPLAPSQQMAWKRWVQRIQKGSEVVFPRTTRPKEAVGRPSIVGFSDASLTATCALIYLTWETPGPGGTVARVLISKCRVTPIHGMTIPRAELQAMVILLRLTVTVLKATEEKFSRVTLATDSKCVLAALHKSAPTMKPYFANRVAEVWTLLKEMEELCPNVEFPCFVPGMLNPSDIGTREGIRKEDIGPTSIWQLGPQFLTCPRETWPLSDEREGEVPRVEMKVKLLEAKAFHSDVLQTRLGISLEEVARALTSRCKSWMVAQGALAMVVRAVLSRNRREITGVVTPRERALAKKIILWAHSGSAFQALQRGELISLGAKKSGGLVVVDGRVRKEELARLLGKSYLPIIMNREPLARLILGDSHKEDHNLDPQYMIARSRREVWIPRATKLAKAVASACMFCRMKNKKMAQQLMGSLPVEKTRSVAPFEITALDMFGPFFVKDVAQGRRKFKTWAVMYCCLATKAVAILSCPGYSTNVFLQTHSMFVSTYTPGSQPVKIYCDHGPQLVAAATNIAWEQVRKEIGCQKTEWIFTPKACSWRNGACERAIRSARHTLQHVITSGSLLDHHQLDAVFHQVAAIMNSRPISVRVAATDRYHSITPSDILLGRAARKFVDPECVELWEEDDVEVDVVASRQHKVVTLWWKAWLSQSFQDLVPRNKWKQVNRGVAVGDICHIIYKSSVGSPLFRLCRVSKVSPDDKKVVRTCTVKFYNRDVRNKGNSQYLPGNCTYLETAVQRLAVLLPVEEQREEQQEQESVEEQQEQEEIPENSETHLGD